MLQDAAGEQTFAEVADPVRLSRDAPAIAVLHDRGTGSSGEGMAIAFRRLPSTRGFGESTYGASTATRRRLGRRARPRLAPNDADVSRRLVTRSYA